MVMGSIFTFALIISLTDYPFWAIYRLGTCHAELDTAPNLIVLLGGGGLPGGDGLNRCYHAARIAKKYDQCKIIIAVPADTSRKDSSPEKLMARELIIRGVDSARLMFENEGTNTHSQALHIRKMLAALDLDTIALQIITSPEHVFRSVAVFRKMGFSRVGGFPSFETDINPESLDNARRRKQFRDERLIIRYNMWNYLKYEITVAREYTAILYYKIRGWM
jgi:uncharacterized SAM-binding protein YcdF (DUF218 family)